MISADQILAHLVGDYILQSDWMATEKTRRSMAAAVHALCYALPFLFFRPSAPAFALIVGTHFVIDRWRLARFVVYAKNFLAPLRYTPASVAADPLGYTVLAVEFDPNHVRPWRECSATGYHESRPAWLTTWLLILTDNTMHLICNGVALRWL